MSLTFATQLTAVATLALARAGPRRGNPRRARLPQAVSGSWHPPGGNKREAAERRMAQASLVFIWTGTTDEPVIDGVQRQIGPHVAIVAHLKNTSQQPVYNLDISWHNKGIPWDKPDVIRPALMPAKQEDRMRIIDPSIPGQGNLA